MNPIIRKLIKRTTLPDGTRKQGAVTRIAEAMGVYHTTVLNWITGKSLPKNGSLERLDELLSDRGFDFAARKTGIPPGKYTWRFGKKREHVYAES